MDLTASGIIGYAGLSADVLLSQGKALFAQADPPVPVRFDTFLPLFPVELIQNMEYVGSRGDRGALTASSGFSVDPTEYFRKLYEQQPKLFTGDNYLRNFSYDGRYSGRGAMTVDAVWAEAYPQYHSFLGDKLAVYLIGGGSQAVAIPESVYPRGGGMLAAMEESLGISEHAEDYVRYVRGRVASGDTYEAESFAAAYLDDRDLPPVTLTQRDIARALQELSLLKSLHGDTAAARYYTQIARRARRVNQYVPMRYACDVFTEEPEERRTKRLAQLCFAENDFVSDLWVPYNDLYAFVDPKTLSLDAKAFCARFQIAPRYDAQTGGGLCPDTVRVATVRDVTLRSLTSYAQNNSAYGKGGTGKPSRMICVPDSAEMIRQRKVALEKCAIVTVNHAVSAQEYRKMLCLACLQERKGRLVDAMYRRETILAQIDPKASAYPQAGKLLDLRVEKLERLIRWETAQRETTTGNGYDADIAYLRRVRDGRESKIAEPRDAEREESIESGYAMRGNTVHKGYTQVVLPNDELQLMIEMDVEEDAPDAALSEREPNADDGYEETLPEDFEEPDEPELAELLSQKAAYQAVENLAEETPMETDDEPVETVGEAPEEALDEIETENTDGVKEEFETVTQETFVLSAVDTGQDDELVSIEKPDLNTGNEAESSVAVTEPDTSTVHGNKAETANGEPSSAAPTSTETEKATSINEEPSTAEDEQPAGSQAEIPDVNAENETDGNTPITETDTSTVHGDKAETANGEPSSVAPTSTETEEATSISEEPSTAEDEQPAESQAEIPDANAENETDGSTPITEPDTSTVHGDKAETANGESSSVAPTSTETEEATSINEEPSTAEDEQPAEGQAESEEQPQATDAAQLEPDVASQPGKPEHSKAEHHPVSMKELAGKLLIKPGKTVPLPSNADGQETPNRMASLLANKHDS